MSQTRAQTMRYQGAANAVARALLRVPLLTAWWAGA